MSVPKSTTGWRRLIVVAIAVFAICMPMQAFAQDSKAAGTLELVDQSDWVTDANPFTLDLKTTSSLPAEETDVVVSVFNSLNNRFSFNQTLDDRISGSTIFVMRKTIAELTGPDGIVHVALPVQQPNQEFFLRDSGVYPVRVELREAGTASSIARFTTHLINQLPTTSPVTKLGVSVVLPIAAAPSDKTDDPFVVPDGGKSVDAITAAVRAHPKLPVTLVPSPESIERLEKRTDTANPTSLQGLTTAATGQTVVRSPWSPLPAAMYANDFQGELNQQFERGAQVLDRTFGSVDVQDWVTTGQIDSNAVQDLRARGVRRIIVPETSLAAIQRDTTLARPFSLSLGRSDANLPAAQADVGLIRHFNDASRNDVLAAHQMLADLAVIWNDRPGQTRAVVAMPPANWTPNQVFLERLLRGMESSPIVQASTLDQLFSTPSEGGSGKSTLVRKLNSISKGDTASLSASRLTDSRKRLSGFATMVDPDNQTLDLLERRLLYSEADAVPTKERSSDLDAFKTALDKQLGAIRMPAERSIRLTARQGEIPVSIQNDTGYPIHVVLRVASDKLGFPNGNSRDLDVERKNVTERFAVDTRTSGAFPVQVRVESPDGSITLVRSRITVRSTATSAVGLVLSIGAGAFLLLWWARSAIRTRRNKRAGTPLPTQAPA